MPKTASKSPRKSTPKKAGLAKTPKFSKLSLIVIGVLAAGIGAYGLVRTFAATQYINYWGTLTSKEQSKNYTLTTGTGEMRISYSNNTKDVLLTIKNSQGTVLKSVMGPGKKDTVFTMPVTSGVYSFSLTTEKAFNAPKGYSVKINYPEQDVVIPTAVLVKPLGNQVLKGTVSVTAEAVDDIGVTKVDFLINDSVFSTDTTAPYEAKWDTTRLADGPYTLKMRSFDASNNVGEASATVTVDNVADTARRFPGDPNPKVYRKAYWGASIAGNGDPARHESPTGKSLSVRRTFWQWDGATNANSSMYKTVADDVAKNRLPFISIKAPSWADVGAGRYDAELDQILRRLDAYGKPIWLVFNHEPEGGGSAGNSPDDPGGAPAWRAMQSRIRQRMSATGVKNIAFMPVVMTYTWEKSSGRTPDDWWVDGIWDAYCVDHYNDSISGNMVKASWTSFVSWVEKKGLPYCIGEWGNRGTDAAAAQEVRDFWNWSYDNKKDLIAYAYFDSSLNSPSGSWELTGEPLKAWQDILKNDSKVQRINDL